MARSGMVSLPNNDTTRKKYLEYATAVGKVAHAWNTFQERLGALLTAILPQTDAAVLLAMWYSEPNDRAQRRMLRAAIEAGAFDPTARAKMFPKHAKDDIIWMLDEADKLGQRRDQAVHAPAAISTGAEGAQMVAAFFRGNPLAKLLKGKDIMYEFDLSVWRAETLTVYAMWIESSLRYTRTWPDTRPSLSRELHRQQRGLNPPPSPK